MATFLCLTFAGTLLLQGVGHYADISLVAVSLPISAAFSAAATYHYFFAPSRNQIILLFVSLTLLWLLSLISTPLLDMTFDGMGYQQPAAEAIMHGWNPLRDDAALLWQRIYPSGAWELGASLGLLYGTIEAAKMLPIWWLFIAAPFLYAGLRNQFTLSAAHWLIMLLLLFCPLIITQLLTHYVDAPIYLAGITFLGAMMLTGDNKRQNLLAWLIMGTCVLFIVNAKLSGIYHAVTLCACAVVFVWMDTKRLPVKLVLYLMATGIFATVFLGFHPYITNLLTYGSLLHMDGNTFSASQRPSTFTDMSSIERFIYSVFSTTGGVPREPAMFKLPWTITPTEFYEAGAPDSRTGGFGVLFALSYLASGILLMLQLPQIKHGSRKLLAVSMLLLVSSLAFPESWWARYVPFGYASILLLLLALPKPQQLHVHVAQWSVIALLTANSFIAVHGTYAYVTRVLYDYHGIVAQLQKKPQGSVYLVPPGEDYKIYNSGYITLQRRLKSAGVETSVKVGAECKHKVANILDFEICY